METKNGVLFGVDYYPEQRDEKYIDEDIRRMKDMGFEAVRMMEFAWILLEPNEGEYDFRFFDMVIEKLAKEGIKVVLGTPTATFPVWLYEKDPEMIQLLPNGTKKVFGMRREGCYNSETYLEASKKIVEEVAKHYGRNCNVIGWQIDNEIASEGSDICICKNCEKKWHIWLEQKYGNINCLNQIWGNVFWGTCFKKFTQIPTIKSEMLSKQNPNLILDYYRFCSDSLVAFTDAQIKILKEHISKTPWITTNLYPVPNYPVTDMEELTKDMDFTSFDYYPIWGDNDEPVPYFFGSYMLSYIRGMNNRKTFAILEQFCGIQGHTALGALPHEKQMVLWTNHAIAWGADKIFYFRWGTAKFGQEQLCYGLFDPDNLDTSRANAITDNIKKYRKAFKQFANEEIVSQACVLYDKDNQRVIKDQYLSKGLYYKASEFMQIGYDVQVAKNFIPFVIFNINADVKSVKNIDISKYKILSLPLYQMADSKFVEKLENWVRDGGHLIIGYRCGAKDLNNHWIDTELPGIFSSLAGVKVKKFESLNNTKVKIRVGHYPCQGEAWADLIEPVTAKPIAWYTDKNKHYKGMPCVTVNSYGKGKVYYIGTSLGETAIFFLYSKILKQAGLNPKFYGMGIEAIKRKTAEGKEIDIVLNHTNKYKWVKWKRVEPYGMVMIKK